MTTVSLLPNAAESFLQGPHPSKMLSSRKFNEKYYNRLIQPYQLLVATESDNEENLERRGDMDIWEDLLDDGFNGSYLSAGEDAENDEDEFYDEGEFGDLFDGDDGVDIWVESEEDDDGDKLMEGNSKGKGRA